MATEKSIVKRFKPGQRFYVFVISITLASAFWLLNALNKTYNKNVNVVVKYINKPAHLAFTRMPPRKVEVEIRGDGFSLFQVETEIQDDTAIIDLESLVFEQIGDRKKVSIPSKVITNKIQKTLSNNLLISNVSIDSLVIRLEPGIRKDLHIKPAYSVVLNPGFTLENPVFAEPNMISVFGPESRLSLTDTLFTEMVDFGTLSKSAQISTVLTYNRSYLEITQPMVTVHALVEQITEGEIDVPIELISKDANVRVRLLPEKVTIKYTTGLSHFDDITPSLFHAKVNFEIGANAPSKLPVVVNEVPGFINVVSVSPERVDYLLINVR